MPLYEYQDLTTGHVIELSRPIRLRDDCPPNLKRVVSRTGRPRIGKEGLPDPSTADQAVPSALKTLEGQIGTSELTRQTGFSPKQMKRIWKC